MGLFKAWRFARGVSLVAAVLLCLGVLLLSLPATGSEMPSALGMADSPHVDQGANGNGYPLDGTYYCLVSAEEAEDAQEDPLNAELLTMLLLAASFGATLGWLLTNAQRQGALLCSLGVVRPSLATDCEDSPFLGVFRL